MKSRKGLEQGLSGIALVWGIAFRRQPVVAFLVVVLAIVLALLPAAQLFALGQVVDGVVAGDRIPVFLIGLLALALAVSTVVNTLQIPLRERLYLGVSGVLLERELDLFRYAPPDTMMSSDLQDQLRVRRDSAESRSTDLLAKCLDLVAVVFTSVGVGSILISISPVVTVLFVLGATMPVLVVNRMITLWQEANTQAATPRRIFDNLFHLGTQPSSFASISRNSGSGVFIAESMRVWGRARRIMLDAETREMKLASLTAAGTLVFVFAGLGYLVWGIDLRAGDVAIVAGSLASLAALNQLVIWASGIFQVAPFLGQLRTRLDVQALPSASEDEIDRAPSKIRSIVFDRVSFSYDRSDANVVSDASFAFEASGLQIVMGENGAGKSTISALAAGSMSPSAGRIFWLDDRGREVAPDWRMVSYLAQEEPELPILVRDFVAMGSSATDAEIRRVLRRCGLGGLLDANPEILSARLGSAYADGVGMSGGQFRRLCLARILLQRRPIWILDEPTSSFDAQGDKMFMDIVRNVSGNALVIVVTHKELALEDPDRVLEVESGSGQIRVR